MDDRPVLVVDLRALAQAEDAASLQGMAPAPLPPDEPLEPGETIALIAVLHDGSDEPLLLSIEPTQDRRWLDAMARLLRFATVRGARIPEAAVSYGGEYERRLAFERRLPRWAYDGVDASHARALPPALRIVLRPRASQPHRG